jgi:hypothetical protein
LKILITAKDGSHSTITYFSTVGNGFPRVPDKAKRDGQAGEGARDREGEVLEGVNDQGSHGTGAERTELFSRPATIGSVRSVT